MFRTFLPNAYVKRPTETSPLNTCPGSESGGQLWKKARSLADQSRAVTSAARQASRNLAQRQPNNPMLGKMHPFKLYQFPEQFRTVSLDASTAWRTFWVRAGHIYIDNADGLFVDQTAGSDGVDLPWYDVFSTLRVGSLIDQTATQYYVADEFNTVYVWIEIDDSATLGSATIHAHIDPTTDGWESFPDFDATHFLIGVVDAVSLGAYTTLLFDQVQVGDIIRPPTKRLTVCEDDGTEDEYDFYAFKYIAPDVTVDSNITADTSQVTTDQ